MKIFDLEVLYKGKVTESVIVKSYQEYQELGGQKDIFDIYSLIKDRAKKHESNYITGMDMSLSGIPVEDEVIRRNALLAQINWYLLHLWFNKPLRVVSLSNFDLDEFNKL